MLTLFTSPHGLSLTSQALLARAYELPVYVTDLEQKTALLDLVAAAEADASPPAWPDCSEALCRRWSLVATTRASGSAALQKMEQQPALGRFGVAQDWRRAGDGELRCENVITIERPDDGLLSAWTLLPPGGKSSLRLLHKARVESESPLRFCIELDALVLDGNRKAGDEAEIIAQAPFPPRLIPNVPPPQLPIPGLKEAVEEAGTFDVTVLDESDDVEKLLVARSARGEVRVFAWAEDVNV